MKPKHQRLIFVAFSVLFISLAVVLSLRAFDENLVYFYSPSDISSTPPAAGQKIRVGGLVEMGSVQKGEGQQVHFIITDGAAKTPVAYSGMLPNLFREGQGVVAEGVLAADKQLNATTILAKHDENYMPKEVVDALKQSGRWQENGLEEKNAR